MNKGIFVSAALIVTVGASVFLVYQIGFRSGAHSKWDQIEDLKNTAMKVRDESREEVRNIDQQYRRAVMVCDSVVVNFKHYVDPGCVLDKSKVKMTEDALSLCPRTKVGNGQFVIDAPCAERVLNYQKNNR